MHDEFTTSLGERLSNEAQQMLGDQSIQPPIANLSAEFQRRRRQRTVAVTLGVAAIVIAGGVFTTAWKPWSSSDDNSAIPFVDSRSPLDSDVPMNPPYEGVAPDVRSLVSEMSPLPPGAIPLLIFQTGSKGETEFMPGWYVPAQVEAIDERELAPAERSAVSRLMGPEFDFSDNDTI